MKIQKTIFLIIFSLVSASIIGQSKYDKGLLKAEASFEIGDYNGAKKNLAKIRKKINSKLGAQNQYTAGMYLMEAKYNLGLGMPFDFESNLQDALNASQKLNTENSANYGSMLIDGAELYNLNGSYRVAKEYLLRSKKILESGGWMKDPLKLRWEFAMAETLTGQGFFNEAIDILKTRDSYLIGRAVKTETAADEKGGLKSRKLSDVEIKQRFGDYARLLTDLGTAYGSQGNLLSADSVFEYASQWIDKNIGDHTLTYAKNQYLHANMLVENGNVTLPKDLEYDHTLLIVKTFFKPTHFLAIKLYEEYMKQLMREENTARFYNTKDEYEKIIKKEFPATSIYKVRLKAVEFDTKLSKDKTKNLESAAVNVLNNTPTLPHNNITTVDILDFLATFATAERKFSSAEKYLNDIIGITNDLYGIEAPEAHLSRLRLANFLVDQTNQIQEAGKIYDESFSKVVEKEIRERHKDHLEILNHLAVYYELTDQYPKASSTLAKAANVAQLKYD